MRVIISTDPQPCLGVYLSQSEDKSAKADGSFPARCSSAYHVLCVTAWRAAGEKWPTNLLYLGCALSTAKTRFPRCEVVLFLPLQTTYPFATLTRYLVGDGLARLLFFHIFPKCVQNAESVKLPKYVQ